MKLRYEKTMYPNMKKVYLTVNGKEQYMGAHSCKEDAEKTARNYLKIIGGIK